MAVDVLDALGAEPRERRRIGRVDAVGPEPVDDEDGDEPGRLHLRVSRTADCQGGERANREFYRRRCRHGDPGTEATRSYACDAFAVDRWP